MQRNVIATILFWGDYAAIEALDQAMDDSFSESVGVFSIHADLFTSDRPRSIVEVLCPGYVHDTPPERRIHSNPLVDVDVVHYDDLTVYCRKNRDTKKVHSGVVLIMHVPEYSPKVRHLVAFCRLRKELFDENIHFKIMYTNYEEDTCGEAVYIYGEEVVDVARDISEVARDIAYESHYSDDVFSGDMWDRLSDWIGDAIYDARQEREAEEKADQERYEAYEEDEEDEDEEDEEDEEATQPDPESED
jgi:hypothetical protein